MKPASGEPSESDAFDELCAYTLTHGDPQFIHQHVVDAYTAQRATPHSKPIGLTFALAGLYLHVEKHYTGRNVQLAHMRMARQKREWPKWTPPANRGEVTAVQVLAAEEGAARDRAIDAWCESVWSAFAPANRDAVIRLLAEYRIG